MVESELPTGEQRPIGRVAKCGARIRRNPLCGSEWLEAIPVVAEDAVFSAYPEEADSVLVDPVNQQVGQAFRASEAAEAVLLGAQRPSCQRQQGKCERDWFTKH